jgi:hypothetical protein
MVDLEEVGLEVHGVRDATPFVRRIGAASERPLALKPPKVPYGTTPDAPARMVLEAEGDGQMRFRLVDWQPPAE